MFTLLKPINKLTEISEHSTITNDNTVFKFNLKRVFDTLLDSIKRITRKKICAPL